MLRIALAALLAQAVTALADDPTAAQKGESLFGRENLVAWCIVPFDAKNRGPEERAAMLDRLNLRRLAYDWRAEHVPTFDAEIAALKGRGIELTAFWAPGELNDDLRNILDVLRRNGVKAQLWCLVGVGEGPADAREQARRVAAAADAIGPIADAAGAIGCTVALYNHGGWFGEPENLVAVAEELRRRGRENVGIVYNLHHGHDHLDRFSAALEKMKPYLFCLNLNGMDPDGDRVGRKILQLGQGSLDLELMRAIRESGYRGPIGIIGHTLDDAEERLADNLDGLDWLLPQLDGEDAGPPPTPRTPVPPRAESP